MNSFFGAIPIFTDLFFFFDIIFLWKLTVHYKCICEDALFIKFICVLNLTVAYLIDEVACRILVTFHKSISHLYTICI